VTIDRVERDADGRLTKSVFVLGVERGMALIATLDDVDAVVVDKDGKIFYSDSLQPSQ
jgi:thiamine biosynthesis lipoprotein